jgi:hypothetical protein
MSSEQLSYLPIDGVCNIFFSTQTHKLILILLCKMCEGYGQKCDKNFHKPRLESDAVMIPSDMNTLLSGVQV